MVWGYGNWYNLPCWSTPIGHFLMNLTPSRSRQRVLCVLHADVWDLFPSVQLSFPELSQLKAWWHTACKRDRSLCRRHLLFCKPIPRKLTLPKSKCCTSWWTSRSNPHFEHDWARYCVGRWLHRCRFHQGAWLLLPAKAQDTWKQSLSQCSWQVHWFAFRWNTIEIASNTPPGQWFDHPLHVPFQCNAVTSECVCLLKVWSQHRQHSTKLVPVSVVLYLHAQLAESTKVSLTHVSTDLLLDAWQLVLQKRSQPIDGVQPDSQWEIQCNDASRFHRKVQKPWSATHSHMSLSSPHVEFCCLQKEINHSMYEPHSLSIFDVVCFHSSLNHWMFQSPKNAQSFSIFLDLQLAFPKPCKSHLLFSNNQSRFEA